MKLPRVTGDKVVRALKRGGFVEIRTRGSHCHLYHEQTRNCSSSFKEDYRSENSEINSKTCGNNC
jgi:predicted RNA binding protein YcfA (HicA-like mRNA interferase family)